MCRQMYSQCVSALITHCDMRSLLRSWIAFVSLDDVSDVRVMLDVPSKFWVTVDPPPRADKHPYSFSPSNAFYPVMQHASRGV